MPLLRGFDWAGFPDLNRSAQLAIAELIAHGGTPEDVRRMADYFKQQAAETENNDQSETIPE
jgi:hypothetical protein